MKSPRPIPATVTILLSVLFLVSSLEAVAQEDSTPEPSDSSFSADVLIAIHPHDQPDGSRFEATLEPGETTEFISLLTNYGNESIELRTYTSDVIAKDNGGLLMADRDTEPTGRTLWMDYSSEEFILQPGESKEKPFTVTVPEGTPPGQYVNAVALETVNPINPGENVAFEQYFRKVVSVYITVPGDLKTDFSVGEPESYVVLTQTNVRIPISNTGHLRIDLEGSVIITDLEGNVIHDQAVRLAPVYMGQDVVYKFGLNSPPSAGDYLISYSFADITTGITVSSDKPLAIQISEPEQAAEDRPIAFENIAIEPNGDPITFANVTVDIALAQQPIRSSRLTVSVFHNGTFVEDFVLAENMALNPGITTVSQRYLPSTNWETGTYTFSLKLESTEGGSTSLLLEEKDVVTLEVP